MLKNWIMALGVMLGLVLATTAQAADIDKTEPYTMMKQVSEQTFARLKAEQTKIHQDPDFLKQIVAEELMPYVNSKYAALKLLGTNLKGAKREDVTEFIDAFHQYLISSYAQVLTQYSDQSVKFGPEPKIDDQERIISIKVDIIDTPRPDIKLEFKLRQDKDGDWEAFDMIAEGVSLLSSKQSEWSAKLRQDGILSVAKELESLAAQPIRFESKSE